jgi:hypothetical protein
MPLHLDFSATIAERTRDFVGREWAFAEIDAWLDVPDGRWLACGEAVGRVSIF